MKTITDNEFGFLLWIAASMAETVQQRDYNGVVLNQTPEENLGWFLPHVHNEQEDSIEELLPLMEGIDNLTEDEGQQTIFHNDFMDKWKTLHELALKGELVSMVCMEETLWGVVGDHDVEVGALIDLSFLMTFHERMSKVKHPVMWRYGPFLVVVDSEALHDSL